jgi:hypothetical protein
MITAEEFMLENLQSMDQQEVENAMIEFARLKVEEAIHEIVNAVDNEVEKDFITEDLIRNAYPLENIM